MIEYADLKKGTRIPERIVAILARMEQLFGIGFEYESKYTYYNRGGWPYAHGESFRYSVCTSSFADGADYDYSEDIKEILLNMGFECEGEGDNGLDPIGSFCRDTYWNYHFIYKKSIEFIDE